MDYRQCLVSGHAVDAVPQRHVNIRRYVKRFIGERGLLLRSQLCLRLFMEGGCPVFTRKPCQVLSGRFLVPHDGSIDGVCHLRVHRQGEILDTVVHGYLRGVLSHPVGV